MHRDDSLGLHSILLVYFVIIMLFFVFIVVEKIMCETDKVELICELVEARVHQHWVWGVMSPLGVLEALLLVKILTDHGAEDNILKDHC